VETENLSIGVKELGVGTKGRQILGGWWRGTLYRLKTVLRSSRVSQYDQDVQFMRKGYVRFQVVWVEANDT
jgi:hypothetical protein